MVNARNIMAEYAAEAKGTLKAKWRQLLYMALLISIWYLFSYAFNASLKDWFRARGDQDEDEHTMLPVLLTVFFSNTAAASIWVLQLTGCLTSPMHAVRGLTYIGQAVLRNLCLDLCLMCAAGAVGIAAACVVLQHGSIQLVQVSRSMGPIFTALWAYLILDQSTRGRAALALALALAGTALASWQEPTFSPLTFCLMLTVNTALTFRNAITKRILHLALPPPQLPPPPHNKPSHSGGGGGGGGGGSSGGGAAPSSAEETARTIFQLPEVMSCVLLAATNAVGLIGVLLLWAAWTAWSSHSLAETRLSLVAAMHMPDTTWMLLAWLGFCSFMYNMASQIVLAHVHVVSHGMLELFKRVFVLLAASALLGDVRWQAHNALGAGIATAATVLYFCTREAGAGGRPAPHAGPASGGGKDPPALPPLVAVADYPPSSLKDRLHGQLPDSQRADLLCPPHGYAMDSMRKKVQGPDRRSSSASGGGGASRCMSPSQRLQLSYVVMVLVLALSPVQFMESLGISFLTPAWLRAPGSEGRDWLEASAAESAGLAPQQLVHPLPGGGSAVGADPSAARRGSSAGFSPGNALVAGNAHLSYSMDVPQPTAQLQEDSGVGEGVLRGGPYHEGLLPYHAGLRRASTTADACSGGGQPVRGKPAQQLAAGAALHPLPRALHAWVAAEGGISSSGEVATAARSSHQGMGAVEETASSGHLGQQATRALDAAVDSATAGGLVGVYTGWLAQDNLGDEIVADIFLDLFTAAIIETTDAGTTVSLERASLDLANAGWRGCTLTNNSACDFGVMGGGSTIYVDYIKRIGGVLAAGKQVLLFGSGFQSGLLPKSSNDKYLQALCKGQLGGGVRGMYTKGHLGKYGCSSSAVPIIRDSALLARVLYSGGVSALRPQLREHSGQRHVVVATLKNESSAVFASAIHTLLRTGKCMVVLQGVDEESTELHRSFAASLNAQLPPGTPPLLVHDEYRDWAAVLDLYSLSSASLNARLHSGVLSASALRPTLYVASNIKYKDFMASLGLRSKLIDSSRRRHVQAGPKHFGEYVAALLADAIRQASLIKRQVYLMEQDTLTQYKAAMVGFLAALERQDPARFRSTLCCKNIRVTRSAVLEKRVLVKVECVQPADGGQQPPL